jgi:hypothetical protein
MLGIFELAATTQARFSVILLPERIYYLVYYSTTEISAVIFRRVDKIAKSGY